jgi:hypothetical protein
MSPEDTVKAAELAPVGRSDARRRTTAAICASGWLRTVPSPRQSTAGWKYTRASVITCQAQACKLNLVSDRSCWCQG